MRTKRIRAAAVVGIVTALSAAGGTQAPIARAAPTIPNAAVCSPGVWVHQTVPPNPAMAHGGFNAATIVSNSDAWAVGKYFGGPTGAAGSLWEHWNGRKWAVVTTGAIGAELNDVTNFGAADVWAVGDTIGTNELGPDVAIIARWNGFTIKRSTIPLEGVSSSLRYVSGSSESDIWAAGTYITGSGSQAVAHTLLYHYNGTSWSLGTGAPTGDFVDGLLDLAPSDIYLLTSAAGPGNVVSLYHFNGSTWSLSQLHPPVTRTLAGTSGTDIYSENRPNENAVEHWNGTAWSTIGAPNPNIIIDSLSEGPVGTVWSVGQNFVAGHAYVAEAGVQIAAAAANLTDDTFKDVATGSGLLFAVGITDDGSGGPVVVMSCD
jgi:hypothetical protein